MRRLARRALLCGILVSAVPVVAQSPSTGERGSNESRYSAKLSNPAIVRGRSKKAVAPSVGAIRTNPFFVATPQRRNPNAAIQLASGDAANLRIKTNGNVIGLQPIAGAGEAKTDASPETEPLAEVHVAEPPRVSQPTIVATDADKRDAKTVAAADAPLIQSFDPAALHLGVEAPDRLDEDHVVQDHAINVFEQHHQRGPVTQAQPALPASRLSKPILHQAPGLIQNAMQFAEQPTRIATQVPETQTAPAVVPVADTRGEDEEVKETQPVFFSLSDRLSDEANKPDPEPPKVIEPIVGGVIAHDPSAAGEAIAADAPAAEAHKEATEEPQAPRIANAKAVKSVKATAKKVKPLSAVSTPVQLAPVVDLSKPPRPSDQPSVPVIRYNPNVDEAATLIEDGEERAVIKSVKPEPAPLESVQPEAVENDLAEPEMPKPTPVKRSRVPVAVTTPPIMIEHEDSSAIEPTVGSVVATPVVEPQLPPPLPQAEPIQEAVSVPSAPEMQELETAYAEDIAPPPVPQPVLTHDGGDVPTQEVTTQEVSLPAPKTNRAIKLQLTRAQVRSLTIGGQLRRVSIDNREVCQAFASGPNQLKLIGIGEGTANLTVWADVVAGQPTKMQTFEIDVNEAVDATGEKVTEHTTLLNDSIQKAFPRASVVVSRQDATLVVTGYCDDESDAKQIIRMVRKSCLVPVEDKLTVRSR